MQGTEGTDPWAPAQQWTPAQQWAPPAEGGGWSPYPPRPEPPSGRDGFAIAGLVLGILPIFGGILGIVFGLVGRHRTVRSGQKGSTMATTGAVLGTLWLVGLVAAAVAAFVNQPERNASGAVTLAGQVAWPDLRVGDCLERDPGNGARMADVTPCNGPHLAEVFGKVSLPTVERRAVRGACLGALNPYVSVPASADPGYEVRYLYSPEGRTDVPVVCMLFAPDREQLWGTVRARGAWHGTIPTPASSPASPSSPLSGVVSTDDLRPGDCLPTIPQQLVTTISVVACSARHLGEVYDVHPLGKGPYPGAAQVDRFALGRCRQTLPAFVGAPAGTTGYAIEYFMPDRSEWVAGSRDVTCVLVDPHNAPLHREARGAGHHA